ncbi:MAG: SDR family NAD(P)-dependent oxidoreductase [Planctomycetes bacterium]|nr:SDR family NAD(P)-dependent oxidoreductase [Planctomycetota bacterium]
MEFRGQQTAKIAAASERPLERQVVIISGGAGAIGAAVAEVCVEAGAHVVITDLDANRIAQVADEINERFGARSALGIVMDVTDEKSVRAGYAEAVRTYGGVDVVVPNAGVAHVSSIEEMNVADFRRVMDINATGYLLFMQQGIRVMKRQGIGGNVVISASKNVFGPGAQFGAYSASKAAGHQLGKVAAIELAPAGIRVNMINADAVFGEGKRRSGLWAEVGPSRAKSRNMDEDELPEYYRGRNLLKARVCGYHVGNAVVFFASNATPTTGATLPVDGGLVDAFPR